MLYHKLWTARASTRKSFKRNSTKKWKDLNVDLEQVNKELELNKEEIKQEMKRVKEEMKKN